VRWLLPKTRLGWSRLWRCFTRCCWKCNGRTMLDPWRYVGGSQYRVCLKCGGRYVGGSQYRVCLKCGGIEHPRGLFHALYLNAVALEAEDEPWAR
jgi:hypothetical protein